MSFMIVLSQKDFYIFELELVTKAWKIEMTLGKGAKVKNLSLH